MQKRGIWTAYAAPVQDRNDACGQYGRSYASESTALLLCLDEQPASARYGQRRPRRSPSRLSISETCRRFRFDQEVVWIVYFSVRNIIALGRTILFRRFARPKGHEDEQGYFAGLLHVQQRRKRLAFCTTWPASSPSCVLGHQCGTSPSSLGWSRRPTMICQICHIMNQEL